MSSEEFEHNPDINYFGHTYDTRGFEVFDSKLEQDLAEGMTNVVGNIDLGNLVREDPRLQTEGGIPDDVDSYGFVPIVRHSVCGYGVRAGTPCEEKMIDGDHYELPEGVTPHSDHCDYDGTNKPPIEGSAAIGIVHNIADGSHLCAVAGISVEGNDLVIRQLDIVQDGSGVERIGWSQTLIIGASIVGERLGATSLIVQGAENNPENIYTDPQQYEQGMEQRNNGAKELDLPETEVSEAHRNNNAQRFANTYDRPAEQMGLQKDDNGNWSGEAGEPLYSHYRNKSEGQTGAAGFSGGKEGRSIEAVINELDNALGVVNNIQNAVKYMRTELEEADRQFKNTITLAKTISSESDDFSEARQIIQRAEAHRVNIGNVVERNGALYEQVALLEDQIKSIQHRLKHG